MSDRDRNYLENREDVVVEEFTTQAALYFEEEINRRFHDNPKKPIIITINSPGGCVDSLFHMIDAMDAISSIAPKDYFYFVTHATGKAMSAGAILLSCGAIKFASPKCRIMLHQISGGSWGQVQDMKIEHDEMVRINNEVLTILAENCKIKGGKEALEKLLNRDLYFTAKEAQDFGLVDIVGTPRLSPVTLYDLSVSNGKVPEEEKSVSPRRTNKKTTKKKAKS